jgi:arylsulfatase A-like enzyme
VETLGEKGSWVAQGSHWGVVSNTPLEGHKFYAGEGGVRVPLIISGLPSINPGEVNNAFVYITDLAPTLLSVAGLALPKPVSGREPITGKSLLPLLERSSPAVRAADEATGYEFSGNAALYRGDFKLLRNQPPVGDRQWRLYNISDDPGETVDLSGHLPDLYRAMQEQYEHWAAAVGVLPMPEDYELTRQVMINSILFFFLPRYLPYLAGLALLIALFFVYRSRQRGRER